MNWTVQKPAEKPFVKVVTEGDFNLTDFLKMIEDIISRDFWKPGTNVLFDHRNLEFGSTDISIIKEACKNHKKYDERIGGGKSALLMKSLADFGRGRQYELVTKGKISAKPYPFLDEAEAVNWLVS